MLGDHEEPLKLCVIVLLVELLELQTASSGRPVHAIFLLLRLSKSDVLVENLHVSVRQDEYFTKVIEMLPAPSLSASVELGVSPL